MNNNKWQTSTIKYKNGSPIICHRIVNNKLGGGYSVRLTCAGITKYVISVLKTNHGRKRYAKEGVSFVNEVVNYAKEISLQELDVEDARRIEANPCSFIQTKSTLVTPPETKSSINNTAHIADVLHQKGVKGWIHGNIIEKSGRWRGSGRFVTVSDFLPPDDLLT